MENSFFPDTEFIRMPIFDGINYVTDYQLLNGLATSAAPIPLYIFFSYP